MTSETVHVPSRNRTLFCCIFVAFKARQCSASIKGGLHTQVYVAHTSPTLNKHSALQHFEHSNAVENTRIITFDFSRYAGLLCW